MIETMAMWALIVFAYAGPMSDGESVALTSVERFTSIELCEAAGKKTLSLDDGTTKVARFVCVRTQ